MTNLGEPMRPAAMDTDDCCEPPDLNARTRGRHLILFTVGYPYDDGETFLEAELPVLSQRFDKVTIVPMVGCVLWRALPANVDVAAPIWSTPLTQYAHFLRQYTRAKTWHTMIKAWCRAVFIDKRRHPAVLYRIFNWGSYRSALEAHPVVKAAIADPQGVVAYSYWAHTPALALPALARAGVACAVRYHRVDLYEDGMREAGYFLRNARYFPWREEVARAASLNMFISEQGHRYFDVTWPNLLGTTGRLSRLGTASPGKHAMSETGSDALVVASCSYIVPQKRVELIAALTRELSKQRPVIWHHFGDGDLGELKRELSCVSPNWHVKLHGWVTNSELREFYRTHRIDLFLNLSTSEGIPVSIMEAMSYDIPVVATDVGGTCEAVVTGRSGLLIGVDDALPTQRLAALILEALEPGGFLARAAPRLLWEARFHADVNYAEMAAQLVGIAQSRQRTTGQ